MSDEDRDIDIESDEDDELGANTQFMTQAEKRAHHNALERKRRDHIKESFHSLRDSIPSLQGEKVGPLKSSRAQILKQATDYIQFMCKKNSGHQHDIEDLKRQNVELDQQVRLFEKTKAAGTFAASQSSSLEGATGSSSVKTRGGAALTSGGKIDSHSDTSSDDSETENRQRRKKLKT